MGQFNKSNRNSICLIKKQALILKNEFILINFLKFNFNSIFFYYKK